MPLASPAAAVINDVPSATAASNAVAAQQEQKETGVTHDGYDSYISVPHSRP